MDKIKIELTDSEKSGDFSPISVSQIHYILQEDKWVRAKKLSKDKILKDDGVEKYSVEMPENTMIAFRTTISQNVDNYPFGTKRHRDETTSYFILRKDGELKPVEFESD